MSSNHPNSNNNEGSPGCNQNHQEHETCNNNVDVQIPPERAELSLSTSYASSLPNAAAAGASGWDGDAAESSQVASQADVGVQIGGQTQVQEQQGVTRARSRSAGSSKSGDSEKMQIDTASDIIRLKRESTILSSLPDPVLAVDIDGSITFANMKMEQLLELELDDLIGINISSFIAPDSVEGYENMIRHVMDSEGQHAFDEGTSGSYSINGSRSKGSDKSDCLNAKSSSPMLKVDVDPGEDITDSSENHLKKAQTKHSTSFCTSASEEVPPVKKAKFNVDDGLTSSKQPDVAMKESEQDLKSPAKKIQHHPRVGQTKQITSTSGTSSSPTGGTSSSPTENKESQSSSVDSSLSNKPAMGKSSSDSGYGESNYSPEEYNSSSPSTVSNAGRVADKVPQKEGVRLHLPLAPSFIICLIRRDLSKVWCELTASVRTRSISDDDSKVKKSRSDSSSMQSEVSEEKELLLCFRPITRGLPDSDITSSSNSNGAEALLQGDRSQGSNGSRSNGSKSGSSKGIPVGGN